MMGELILIFVLVAIAYPVQGLVLSVMWRWFVVPTFGLPELSVPVSIGLAIVVGFLTHQSNDAIQVERGKAEKYLRYFGLSIFGPLFTLLIAWIVYQFV